MASNEEFSISNFNAIIKTSIKVFTVWLLVIKNGVMGGQWKGVAVQGIKLPPAASSTLPFILCLVSLFKTIFLIWFVTVTRAGKTHEEES